MAIQLAGDSAPNGARPSMNPLTRPPPPSSRRPSAANVDSHTVRKHRTWRHRPPATASMAAITDPPGPGRSPPPLIHVGCSLSDCSSAVTPPSLVPLPPLPPEYVGTTFMY